MASTAAIVYVVLTGIVVLFQFALALGAPWGHLAMGGKFPGRFPPAMRVAAVVQALVLSALAGVVVARSGWALPGWSGVAGWLIWVVVGVSFVSLAMNSITPSRWERILWAPVAGGLFISALWVALS